MISFKQANEQIEVYLEHSHCSFIESAWTDLILND